VHRLYFVDWQEQQAGLGRTFWMDHNPQIARRCGKSRDVAEQYRQSLNRARIEVQLLRGSMHICGDFQIEDDIWQKELIVYCDVPSVVTARPT
jgi:hypothetical protein